MQEALLVEDVLDAMLGAHGRYVVAHVEEGPQDTATSTLAAAIVPARRRGRTLAPTGATTSSLPRLSFAASERRGGQDSGAPHADTALITLTNRLVCLGELYLDC